jgi:propanol-preferring alcohol dehydrogenase
MVLERPGTPLRLVRLARRAPGPDEVLVKVAACGVCRTDLHVVDGDLAEPRLPIVPGHEIVGRVESVGSGSAALRFRRGDRVGIPWLGHTCGTCIYCKAGRENLCDRPRFTGYQTDGGYAEYATADARYCFPLPERYGDVEAAPLLCAGLIGYRSLAMAGKAERLGIYGFGAAAHIVAQVARFQGRSVYAFTRPGDADAQAFALRLGCVWVGGSDRAPPLPLDAAIVFAPVGALVPAALAAVRKGGTVVLGGIHMSDIPAMPYRLLWGERSVRSVANLTRADAEAFLALAANVPIETETVPFPLSAANEALERLRAGRLTGAAVLVPDALLAAAGPKVRRARR